MFLKGKILMEMVEKYSKWICLISTLYWNQCPWIKPGHKLYETLPNNIILWNNKLIDI